MAFNNPDSQLGEVQIQDQSGVVINPATEETLQAIASGLGATTNIYDGSKDVTLAGTAVPLSAASVSISRVVVTAKEQNVGTVVVGSSTVVAAQATRRGTPLTPLSSMDLSVSDLNKVYIDAENNNDGVTFTYYV